MSCTSCEDERNALCAKRIYDVNECVATSGLCTDPLEHPLPFLPYPPSNTPHAGLECSFWIKDKSVWDQQLIILLYKATPPKLTHDRTRVTWPHLSHSRAFQWDIRTGFDPNPVESSVWASSTMKTRPCFILEMVLKDFWRKPTCRQSVDYRPTVDRQSADCVSTDSRPIGWPTVDRQSLNYPSTVGR